MHEAHLCSAATLQRCKDWNGGSIMAMAMDGLEWKW
jgi:hypothetical protein